MTDAERREDDEILSHYHLTDGERCELKRYAEIARWEGFKEHKQVVKWIDDNGLWFKFPNIRAINDHEVGKGVPGIHRRFFPIACRLLNIGGSGGSPLINSTRY